MFVRVYDSINNQYYKSVVYALVMVKEASPWCIMGESNLVHRDEEYAVVLNPISKEFEMLSRFIHRTELIANVPTVKSTYRYNDIQRDSINWNTLDSQLIKNYKVSGYSLTSIRGYEDVLNNTDFLERILKFEKIPQSEAGITIRKPDDSDVWNYIFTQNDALLFLGSYDYFHDGEIVKVMYEEKGDYTCKMTVDLSVYPHKLQLCFEGDLCFNLRRNDEYAREMAYSNILVSDKDVLWISDERNPKDIDDETTYAQALSLKWRKI